MASNAQPDYFGDIVKYYANRDFCFETRTIKTGVNLVPGSICGDDTGMAPLLVDPGPPVDGDAEAIYLGEAVTSAAADTTGLFLVRGPAVVDGDQLDFNTATSEAQAITALNNLDIRLLSEAPDIGDYV